MEEKRTIVALLTDCVIHRRFNMACNRMLKYRIAKRQQVTRRHIPENLYLDTAVGTINVSVLVLSPTVDKLCVGYYRDSFTFSEAS
jgi:hypothetical protein